MEPAPEPEPEPPAAAAAAPSPASPPGPIISGPIGVGHTVHASPRKDAQELELNQRMIRIAEDLEDAPYLHNRDPEVWSEWTRVLTTPQLVAAPQREKRIKYLIRQGIPNPLRPKLWPLLANLDARADQAVCYPLLLQSMECEYEEKIMKDLARTFPMHPLFTERGGVGQQKMFNVLKAYAVHDKALGYCQGMAFVVGILLMKLPEAETFTALSTIMSDPLYDMRGIYDPQCKKMPFFFYVVNQLLHEYVPEVWEHFQAEGIEPSMFATQWFMTLYGQKFPFSVVLRIWDIFLAEGLKIVFRVAVALVQCARAELVELDFVGILDYFRNEIVTRYDTAEAQSALMTVVGNVKIKPKKLQKLERDFAEMKRQEAAAEDPLKRLENELRLKEAELQALVAEKAEAEQVALDMRILMLQTEDVKSTMISQLQAALAAQSSAEARSALLEEKLREAGLYTEEYSSAALEMRRASAESALKTVRSAGAGGGAAVYQQRAGSVVEGPGGAVGGGVGYDATKQALTSEGSGLGAAGSASLRAALRAPRHTPAAAATHRRSGSGGGVGAGSGVTAAAAGVSNAFWEGVERLSGKVTAKYGVTVEKDAAISHLQEGKSRLENATSELSEKLSASESSNDELRKELEDTKELLANSEQVRHQLQQLIVAGSPPLARSVNALSSPTAVR